ncbi:MAG: hypothetical protein L6Q95_01535 [Planctomycetes bacterium]|nr:hypothetical protein [Planctomycetota bacterium]
MQGLAQAHAARCGLTGYASELAQDALSLLWERSQSERRPIDAEEAEKLVAVLANAERDRREAERRHLARKPHAGARASGPRLCAALAGLADLSSKPSVFRKQLARAARCLARDRNVLRDRQFRIFDFVWVAGNGTAAAAEAFGLSARALDERLIRISRRIQGCLVEELRAFMPRRRWLELRSSTRIRSGVAPSRELADAVLLGLGQVIHNAGHPQDDIM